jgi:serine/threonine protein kinase
LHHPHIVKMLDGMLNDDIGYLVMEYVEGGSMQAHASAERLLPFATVAEIMYKCCKALEYAQIQGVIHRDIKPANILLSGASDIKLSDFGSAIIDNNENTQVEGVGSPAYMSPEQISSKPLTHQTDIYSLGVTMYKLLTGRLPFESSNHSSLTYQIVHGQPSPARDFRPDIPDKLDAIIQRATRRELSQRYQTWEEFAQDLTSFFAVDMTAKKEIFDTEKFDAMRSLSFFESFSDVELWEALRFSKWHKVGKGASILNEGDSGNAFFIVANGIARVLKQGKELSLLHKGDCFGEIKRFPGSTYMRTTSVEAGTDVTLIEIELDILKRATPECRFQFEDAFMFILLKRLDAANTRISSLLGKQAN